MRLTVIYQAAFMVNAPGMKCPAKILKNLPRNRRRRALASGKPLFQALPVPNLIGIEAD
jgi:hypothetical protein